jgi:SNF2 family DNA or RNA helicase
MISEKMEKRLEYPFKTKPYDHQLTCWRNSRDREVYALFMEMGTGKSKVLVDTIAYQYDKGMINGALIVAPKGCYMDFYDEHIPTHMPEHVDYKIAYWAASAKKKELQMLEDLFSPGERLRLLIMNVEAFTTKRGTQFAEKFLCATRALMAVDESTSIKHLSSMRTKNILKLRKFAKVRRIMTGDPTANSPLDLYAQCAFLDPHLLGFESFYTFKARYANLVTMNLGSRTFMKVDGYRDLDDLSKSLKPFSFIIKKDECLDLPPKVYQKRRVEMTPKQSEAYEQMKRASVVFIEGELDKKVENLTYHNLDFATFSKSTSVDASEVVEKISTAELVITQLGKLHQISCGFLKLDDGSILEFDDGTPRLDALVELLQELPKAVVWANYRHNIFQIEERLKKEFGDHSVVSYFGDTQLQDRRDHKTKFRDLSSGVRFFLANPATAKFGLTLVEASTAIYYSNNYDREERAQSEDRIHRIGQIKNANIVDLYVRGTVDEKILKVLRNKQKLSEQITKSNWKEWLE